jgi:hypothetical protein
MISLNSGTQDSTMEATESNHVNGRGYVGVSMDGMFLIHDCFLEINYYRQNDLDAESFR